MSDFTKEVSEYLRQIKQGDQTQFEPLFKTTTMHLRSVARLYLKNKSLDEDVVADAFVKIWSYIQSYDCDKDGYNWMCRIVQNIAYNYNKKEDKIAYLEGEFLKERKLKVDESFNEVEFFMQLDVLEEFDKKIAIARFYLGMTFEEIGEEYNICKATAYQRVRKICQTIKLNRERSEKTASNLYIEDKPN